MTAFFLRLKNESVLILFSFSFKKLNLLLNSSYPPALGEFQVCDAAMQSLPPRYHPVSFFESREVFETFPLSLAKSSVRMSCPSLAAPCLLHCIAPPALREWHFCMGPLGLGGPRRGRLWPRGLSRTRTGAGAGMRALPGPPATSGPPGQGSAPSASTCSSWGDLPTPAAGFCPWLGTWG